MSRATAETLPRRRPRLVPRASGLAVGQPPKKSRLTGCGSPLEIGFTTGSTATRLTVDPALHVEDPAARLEKVIDVAASLGRTMPTSILLDRVQGIQSGPLTYGAWLGLPVGSPNCKFYVDVPSLPLRRWKSHFPAAAQCIGATVAARHGALTMLGVMSDDSVEFYLRLRESRPDQAHDFCKPLGSTQPLRDLVESHYGHRLTDRWPGGSIGLSYSLSSDGSVTAMALYVFARCFWGRDSNTRRRFAAAMRERGTDSSRYLALTRRSAANETCLTQHGLLGFVYHADGRSNLNIGYCPAATKS